jgi:ABC-type multidrug transport system fused ATPase/permease subunit
MLLVEPTSAVDAHTEARIAARVAEHRRGRTTLVTTASPLWLRHADEIALIVDGKVAVTGTHEGLLATSAAYRDVVARGMETTPLQPFADEMDGAAGRRHEGEVMSDV